MQLSVTHILIQSIISNVNLHQSLFNLLVFITNLFPFEVVQNANICQFCALRENFRDTTIE